MISSKLPKSVQKVQEVLDQKGVESEVMQLPDSTRTAKEAAKAIACTEREIAKSIIFRNKETDEPILVVISGIYQVDLKKIQYKTGLRFGKAEGSWVKEKIGFAIGGVPPLKAHPNMDVFLDESLKELDTIWAAAGSPFSVFKLKVTDLEKLTSGVYLDLKEKR